MNSHIVKCGTNIDAICVASLKLDVINCYFIPLFSDLYFDPGVSVLRCGGTRSNPMQ